MTSWAYRFEAVEGGTDVVESFVPVYVVIGPRTASGAEAPAYCLQALGRAIVVGQNEAIRGAMPT